MGGGMNLITGEGNLEPGFSIHGMYVLQFLIRLVAFFFNRKLETAPGWGNLQDGSLV